MSLSDFERECIVRLAELFEAGTQNTSCNHLFEGMPLETGQKKALCDRLAQRQLIEPTYQMGQLLPYAIRILPGIMDESPGVRVETYTNPATGFDHRSTILPPPPLSPAEVDNSPSTQKGFLDTAYRFAKLWFGDPKTRFAKYFAAAGIGFIAAPWWQPIVQQLAVKHLGVDQGFLREADVAMFWSGWALVIIAVVIYASEKQRN